nr:MAG TPA: Putative ferredoxin-4S single cluster domain protein [Bacteriophage sp.]
MNYDTYRLLISGNSEECRERKTIRVERKQVCEGCGLCPVF